jgi:hypothetical protein
MSFDVFLQKFENGKPAEVRRQPVLEVLRSTDYRGPGEYGTYVVHLRDGTVVELSASGLESQKTFQGCAFWIRGFSHDLLDFMLQIARAGEMVMLSWFSLIWKKRLVALVGKG